jgi:hypothetical protein
MSTIDRTAQPASHAGRSPTSRSHLPVAPHGLQPADLHQGRPHCHRHAPSQLRFRLHDLHTCSHPAATSRRCVHAPCPCMPRSLARCPPAPLPTGTPRPTASLEERPPPSPAYVRPRPRPRPLRSLHMQVIRPPVATSTPGMPMLRAMIWSLLQQPADEPRALITPPPLVARGTFGLSSNAEGHVGPVEDRLFGRGGTQTCGFLDKLLGMLARVQRQCSSVLSHLAPYPSQRHTRQARTRISAKLETQPQSQISGTTVQAGDEVDGPARPSRPDYPLTCSSGLQFQFSEFGDRTWLLWRGLLVSR